jgi:RND family efflux transporter MFP subunit
MASNTDKSALLGQLRIARDARDSDEAAWSPWRIVGWALALLGTATVAAIGAMDATSLTHRAVPVQLTTAAAPYSGTAQTAVLQATGYVTARREATVSAQITGSLAEVLIEEGEHVHAGEVLARLDDSAQRATLQQDRAQLVAAQALLGQYEAQIAQARLDLKRDEALAGAGVSEQALEAARTQVRTDAAQLASQRAQVTLARAAVRGAEVQLAYTVIRAPFSGVITDKAAQQGEIVSPMSAGGGFTRTGIGTVVDMDSLEIDVDVNEAYIHEVHPGQPVQAVLDAYPEWNIPAHVIAIVPSADRSKGTVPVRIAIDQTDPRILPDMGVRVSFLEQTAERNTGAAPIKGVLIPSSAIVQRNNRDVVFTVAAGRARVTAVTAGQTFGDLRLVQGLENGVRVVRAPSRSLADGARVVIEN